MLLHDCHLHVEPRAAFCGVGAGVTGRRGGGGGGESCSVLSDFSNFPPPSRGRFRGVPASGWALMVLPSPPKVAGESARRRRKSVGDGKWALPQVSGGGGEEGESRP